MRTHDRHQLSIPRRGIRNIGLVVLSVTVTVACAGDDADSRQVFLVEREYGDVGCHQEGPERSTVAYEEDRVLIDHTGDGEVDALRTSKWAILSSGLLGSEAHDTTWFEFPRGADDPQAAGDPVNQFAVVSGVGSLLAPAVEFPAALPTAIVEEYEDRGPSPIDLFPGEPGSPVLSWSDDEDGDSVRVSLERPDARIGEAQELTAQEVKADLPLREPGAVEAHADFGDLPAADVVGWSQRTYLCLGLDAASMASLRRCSDAAIGSRSVSEWVRDVPASTWLVPFECQ